MKIKEHESLLIAFFATIVRYYDYALFGLSAAILSKNFMPGAQEEEQMLGFFAIFSLSMLARPLGSIIFGKIGDRLGRVVSVKIAASMAAISTCMIAFIPNFSVIGWLAVALVTLCRMIFLISLAGEIDAIKLYVAEKVGKGKRHFVIGIVSFSSQLGALIASIAFHIAMSFSELEWVWRGNFVIGGLLGCIVIVLRGKFQESEEFLKNKAMIGPEFNASILDIIKKNKTKFIASTIINGMLGSGYHFLIIFFGTFIANVVGIIPSQQASSGNIILITIYAISCLISGYVADKVKVMSQITAALFLSISCTLIMEFILGFEVFSVWLHRAIVFTVPFYAIPCTVKIQSLFPTAIRMRMCSLAHSVGSVLFSSTTPFICMLIWRFTRMPSLIVAYFLLQLGVLFFVLLYVSKQDYASMYGT